ncbi:arsenite methyltransferase [Aliifodinibius sp. S!AR15-10]|uniref:arsenite methyltransferase n=1 Tax=Aliifodinibius sp. S!AR15-10 TaxID=2950437 RepID=UPI002854A199|nr:arsenite methyltransferase [Aliifodinibius sp. S!AR15-10]MDR8393769.1 arsenite methyltransferase [Aliifodinibius sp. S!AR15-10]
MSTKKQTDEELKETVKAKYNQISGQSKDYNTSSCCGSGEASDEVYNIMNDDYSSVEGYNKDADLGLGCGLPTEFAHISEGDTVIDLGSGAGNDCFVARHETGPTGKVLGIDFAESMITKARKNAEKLSFNNVEFRYGDIEDMPVSDNLADVIVSNCVLNLVPNKQKVFSEILRVLKPGGHFSISDIVLVGDLPEALREDAEMYAGCVAGAIQKEDYLGYIKEQGFENITLQKEKTIVIPDDILDKYLSEQEIEDFKNGSTGIYSITVFAQKPGAEDNSFKELEMVGGEQSGPACTPGSGCC